MFVIVMNRKKTAPNPSTAKANCMFDLSTLLNEHRYKLRGVLVSILQMQEDSRVNIETGKDMFLKQCHVQDKAEHMKLVTRQQK